MERPLSSRIHNLTNFDPTASYELDINKIYQVPASSLNHSLQEIQQHVRFSQPVEDYVSGVVFICNGSTLLAKRSEKSNSFQGVLEFPSGRLEKGEGLKEAAFREAEEEIGIKLEWGSGPLSQDSSKERSFNYHLCPRDYAQWDSAYLQFFVNQRTKKLAMCATFAVLINPDSIRLCPQPYWIEEITGDSSAGNCYQKLMLKVKTSQKFNVQEEEVDSAGWASGDVIRKVEVDRPEIAGSGRPCMLESKKLIVLDILAKFP